MPLLMVEGGGHELVKNSDDANGGLVSRPSDKGKEPICEVPPFGKSNHPTLLISTSFSSYTGMTTADQ